eukprot:Em0003g1739a
MDVADKCLWSTISSDTSSSTSMPSLSSTFIHLASIDIQECFRELPDFEPLGVLCLVTSARSKSPDGFDAVLVQNVGSTYIIASWDLPTHSPLTPTGTALQLERGVGRHQFCSQPAQHEKDSPPGGPPDPESDTNGIVFILFINKIINPDKFFGSSDPMCILLQLSSLLVEHTAPTHS